MRRFVVVAVVAAAGLEASCSGSTESSEPVATNDVRTVKSYRFEPNVIDIEAGGTVTWTNDDNFTHTVQIDGQGDHEAGRGESYSLRFEAPGTDHYVCTLHNQDMDGEVIAR